MVISSLLYVRPPYERLAPALSYLQPLTSLEFSHLVPSDYGKAAGTYSGSTAPIHHTFSGLEFQLTQPWRLRGWKKRRMARHRNLQREAYCQIQYLQKSPSAIATRVKLIWSVQSPNAKILACVVQLYSFMAIAFRVLYPGSLTLPVVSLFHHSRQKKSVDKQR